MSGEVVGWAMKQHTGSPAAKLVLVKLADNANEQGVCWPSIDLMVSHTELAQSTVYKHLAALESMGLIVPTEIVRKGQVVKAYQLTLPEENSEAIPPRGISKRSGKTIPPDGIPSPLDGKTIPPGGMHIEEPSIEPSENRHSHAEGENDGPPWAGKQPEPGKPDPKAWPPSVWPTFVALPHQSGDILEADARKRWEAIPWDDRPTAPELIACVEAYSRDLARINATRAANRPQSPKQPDNWIRDRRYLAFLDAVRADRMTEVENRKAGKPTAVLPEGVVGRLRQAGFDTANIDGWFGGSTFEWGPPVRWTVPKMVQQERLSQGEFGRRMRRAFGDDVLIDVVKQVAA
ncbi:MAG TPA: helix-turn-helix domain-containing protein [Rhizomicrobium sp.]|jgi:DNA-binding transcriptional ArsR family regulator|nr:helix-turn-helix domain-containing protein [Rhizomicrobium sp.]